MRGGRGGRVASLDVSRTSAEAGGGRRVAAGVGHALLILLAGGVRRLASQSAGPSQVGWASTGKAQEGFPLSFFDLFLFFYLTATVGL